MIQSAFSRRLVSSVAIVMLVWCQTAAAAHGCLGSLPTPPVAESAAAAPCHEAVTDHGKQTTQQQCETRCQARDASFESAKIHLPAVDDLPFVIVAAMLPAPVTACTAPNDQIVERAASPPLILVYCRLLN